MAQVGRFAGALLLEAEGRVFLIGNPKEPCDFGAAGFQDPGPVDALTRRATELRPLGPVVIGTPRLEVDGAPESLAEALAQRLLIHRNASVSERLWRLVLHPEGQGEDPPKDAVIRAQWLIEVPAGVWDLVRDRVLTCV